MDAKAVCEIKPPEGHLFLNARFPLFIRIFSTPVQDFQTFKLLFREYLKEQIDSLFLFENFRSIIK